MTDEFFEEGVRACRVVRRVRHRQDGLVRTLREPYDLAERRISQLLGQQLQKMAAAGLLAREGLAQTFHGTSLGRLVLKKITHESALFNFRELQAVAAAMDMRSVR